VAPRTLPRTPDIGRAITEFAFNHLARAMDFKSPTSAAAVHHWNHPFWQREAVYATYAVRTAPEFRMVTV
jgi:hypothetical protein